MVGAHGGPQAGVLPIRLRLCYAMPGTGVQCAGTDIWYAGSDCQCVLHYQAGQGDWDQQLQVPLSSYACARRLPALAYQGAPGAGNTPISPFAMSVRCAYAMLGTDIRYAAIRREALRLQSIRWTPLSAYARATRCPVLSERMVLPAPIPPVARRRSTLPLSAYVYPMRCPVLTCEMDCVRCAMSGTDAPDGTSLRMRYAMSVLTSRTALPDDGADAVLQGQQHPHRRYRPLSGYAICQRAPLLSYST
eukprot:3543883-Rhodomonas_salina.1